MTINNEKRPLWAPWRIDFIRSEKERGCFICRKSKASTRETMLENHVVAHGNKCFVLMNNFPYSAGHLMISPYEHVKDLSDLDPEVLNEMMQMCVTMQRVLDDTISPEGYNIGFNIGSAAGAGHEEHLHLHIVPRWNGDSNFMATVGATRVIPEALDATCALLSDKYQEYGGGILLSDCIEYLGELVVSSSRIAGEFMAKPECDSRKLTEHNCFIAVSGTVFDANTLVPEILASGVKTVFLSDKEVYDKMRKIYPDANLILFKVGEDYNLVGLIAEFYYGFPAKKLKLIGVTGTNGKTTTTAIITHLLRWQGIKTTYIGTLNFDIDGEVQPATHTTPDALVLQQIFAESVNRGVEYVVMEVSSHAVTQDRLGTSEFQALGFTNLSGEHLDYHKTIEQYFAAKSKLFNYHLAENGTTVINTDDNWAKKLFLQFDHDDIGFHRLKNIELKQNSSSFVFDDLAMTIPLAGEFNIYNTITAVSIVAALGFDKATLASIISKFPGVPGRMERVCLKSGATAYIDYAHTDAALENVGSTLKQLPHNKIISVFGCGGDRDRTKRPRMAKAVSEFSDIIIVTSDNSRSEQIGEIFEDIKQGFPHTDNVAFIPNRAEAIAYAVELSEEEDILLVAGKGHENYQIEDEVTHYFSDKDELEKFI